MNGAALDVPEAAPIHEVRQRCELCLECFSTPADLVQHLQAQHGLQGLSYNESRDSLDGSSACSHCGQLFLTLAGLRSHIVQGRCQFFNPQATAETLPVDNMWKEACLDGKFLEILRPPAVRMRLTIVCQACGKGCQRASDLSLHLQSAHSRLWRQSQRLTMILVDVYYQYQCFCNPSTGVKRGNHICLPFRQLAMAFHRLDMEPFAPTVITDQALKDILAASLQHDLRYRLEQALVHRKFEDTWQDPGLLQLLRSTCLLCGELHPTADLTLHFREEHNCRHEMFLFYMEQLLPIVYALNLDDFQCRLCGLIYNLPAALRPDESLSDRAQLAHSHLKGSCPVLIQLAQLFGALLNGSSLRHGTTRHGGLCSDEGGIRGTGITVCGSNPGPSRESQADQSAQARRAKRPRCRDGRPSTNRRSAHASHEDADNHGSTVDQTRSRTSGPSKDGSIHSFLNPDPTGALHLLLHETVQWKEKADKMEDSSMTQMMPLRQHLMLALLTSMRNRLAKLMTSKETDQIYITSVDKGLILADRSFPYHRWDPKTQTLVLDKKTPVSAKKMDQHLEELVEMMQDRELVMRFHALRAPDLKSDRVVPWRLQINLRSDRAYDLLFHLAHNSIWMAVGATMKQHTLHQTPMATALQNMLGPPKGQGKGKQKGHKKSQTAKSAS